VFWRTIKESERHSNYSGCWREDREIKWFVSYDHYKWKNNWRKNVDVILFLNCLYIWFHLIELWKLQKCCRVCGFAILRDFSFPPLTTSDIQKMGIEKNRKKFVFSCIINDTVHGFNVLWVANFFHIVAR
jgi:hypothetical protein